jgi:MoaA/NifB/PqqE/SkfB family radical SAM enzyme
VTDLVVVARATERCDATCGFCAYDARLARPRRELDAGEALRLGALLAAWGAARGRRVLVSWLGGEPLLWPPLGAVSEALRAAGLGVALTSNGRALARPAWRDFALATLDELTLSLDGPSRLHDPLRGHAGLADAVLGTLAELRARRGAAPRPRLRVNAVLMRRTVEALPELVARVAAAGADELTVNGLGGRDRPDFFPAERLRPADVARAAAVLAGAAGQGLVVRGGAGYLARLRAAAEGRAVAVADCAPGASFLFVEVDGRVAPCSFTVAEHGVPLAELRAPADLDALPARLAAARAARRAAACDDCPSTQVHGKWGPPS